MPSYSTSNTPIVISPLTSIWPMLAPGATVPAKNAAPVGATTEPIPFNVPAYVKALVFALVSSIASTTRVGELAKSPVAPNASVPPETVVVPEYVLAASNVVVPPPIFVTLPPALSTPE